MFCQKLRYLITKQDEASRSTVRGCLLVWAIMRLVVSVIYTVIILIKTVVDIKRFVSGEDSDIVYNRLLFDIFAILVQLVEFGMIVTFITAGVKRSAKLYRAYYRYCILTLITYIIAVILCSSLTFDNGHYFGEVYLTYHFNDLPVVPHDFVFTFILTAAVDVGLEILLIFSIKELIKAYSFTSC